MKRATTMIYNSGCHRQDHQDASRVPLFISFSSFFFYTQKLVKLWISLTDFSSSVWMATCWVARNNGQLWSIVSCEWVLFGSVSMTVGKAKVYPMLVAEIYNVDIDDNRDFSKFTKLWYYINMLTNRPTNFKQTKNYK